MTAVLPPSSPPLEETWKHGSKVVVPFQQTGDGIEVRLRHAAQDKMLRVTEYFKDFDPLRSGFISNNRFHLCLNEHLGLVISDEDFDFLVRKYGQEKPGMINYKAFEEAMGKYFDPSMLDGYPGSQIKAFERSAKPTLPPTLDENERRHTDYLLHKCHDYYQTRGITLKSCYCDFDRHHRGYITETQFHRSFPGPADVSAAEISLLAQRYYDASNGLCNYIKFHDDVVNAGLVGEEREGPPKAPVPGVPRPPSIEQILARIRDAVYKKGIRTTDFFCDFDKLRSGVVPENKFLSGLTSCCGAEAGLSSEEVQRIANHYRTADGRVRYTEFCHIMENAYNEPNLEKKPLVNVHRPLRGHLTKPLSTLPGDRDALRLTEILEYLRNEVKTRRILLHPYFRDFDKGKGFTKGVTRAQFERILYFLNLNLSTEDMRILATRFAASNGIDVNYIDFIQSIDQLFVGQIMEGERVPVKTAPTNPSQAPVSPAEVQVLLSRLREHVNRKRLRPTDYFCDADPLRSGTVTVYRFRQGLSSMGKPDLTEAQFRGLCSAFSDPNKTDHVLWKQFVSILEDPIVESAVSVPIPLPLPELPEGAVDFAGEASDDDLMCLQDVLYRLAEKVRQRRILIEPVFQDFDRNYIGYITRSQFRQCLVVLRLEATPSECQVMERAFCDSRGFNYRKFLQELVPPPSRTNVYPARMTQMEHDKKAASLAPSRELSVSIMDVLDKIKAKVSRERIRVDEFMKDYDKLNSGTVNLNVFSRAMDVCGFELTTEDLLVIQHSFPSSKEPNGVDYMAFADEIESIFTTKGLEKNPTAELELFVPPPQTRPVEFSEEEEVKVDTALHRVADRVRQHRMQLFPLFQDYDRVNMGSVSRRQLHRVLTELGLADLVSDHEMQLICQKFLVLIGNRKDVNYVAFCHKCNEYAQNIWP